MDTLTELAIKHKTDKWGKHNYTPFYYKLFQNKSKRKRVRKVLEIGAGEGAGLRMFRDFFTNAMIYGAEIDKGRVFKEERIEVIECDQTKREDLVNLLKITGLDLDLVIDDGSHQPKDQVYTCLSMLAGLEKGCTYVIEDVADPKIIKEIKKHYKARLVVVGDRYDDQLIVIKK